MYKYRIFLKSGASFDFETDCDIYNEESDIIEDYLDGSKEASCHFSYFCLNDKNVVIVSRKEIAAILVLNGNDNKN